MTIACVAARECSRLSARPIVGSAAGPAIPATASSRRSSSPSRARSTTWSSSAWPSGRSRWRSRRGRATRRAASTRCSRRACEAVLPACRERRHQASSPTRAPPIRWRRRRAVRELARVARPARTARSPPSPATTCSRWSRTGDFASPRPASRSRRSAIACVSANAYLGAEPIVEALARGADVVITGRVADPSLFIAPLVHEFGWSTRRLAALGRGTLAGHLLECAGQITGGYFADPGAQGRRRTWRGSDSRSARSTRTARSSITKVTGSGGRVTRPPARSSCSTRSTIPRRYLTPDVVADFSRVDDQRGRRRTACAWTARPAARGPTR